jgi:vitamin B12 transporter
MLRNKIASFLLVAFFIFSLAPSVLAMSEEDRKNFMKMSEEERKFLLMYFDEDELFVVSTTRSLKSITRIAENVEVVTAADIELMNAHTLADVLNTVNGVVVMFGGASPGSIAGASIQGSAIEHVVVMIDGISISPVSDWADLPVIPAQIIEKVEIIKGPASSVWGSSLGGVINVITKSPRNSETPGGTVSASYGERGTADIRAEITGRKSGLGYYFSAGRLQTDGLRPVEEISSNYLYLKLNYDLTSRTNLGLSLFYNKGDREQGDFSAFDQFLKDRGENLLATVSLNSSLSQGLDLNLSLRASRLRFDTEIGVLSTDESDTIHEDNRRYGATAKLNWKTGMHNVVFGSDYDYKKLLSTNFVSSPSLNIFAVYVNDTISINKLSITPGIRYDYTDRNADFVSPSLGITYELGDKTILRAIVARGFHLPVLGETTNDGEFFRHNPDLKPEEVWSYQAGIESGLLKYIWLKASVFRHDISDAIVPKDIDVDAGTWTDVNADEVRRQGVEVELRSMKFYNLTLSAAATFVNSENLNTGREIHNWPDYTYDVSLKYDDEKSLRALLQGRYVWWHQDRSMNAKYSSFIFDANIIKTIFKNQDRSCEVFLTGHNIFDSAQYVLDLYKNAERWIEAGVRYKF